MMSWIEEQTDYIESTNTFDSLTSHSFSYHSTLSGWLMAYWSLRLHVINEECISVTYHLLLSVITARTDHHPSTTRLGWG